MHKIILGISAFVLLLLPMAHGHATPKPGSMSVTPAFTKLILQKGQQQQTASVTIKNNFASDLTFTASIAPVDDSRGSLVPTFNTSNTLSQNISVTPASFDLTAGKSINLQITVTDSASLRPGGSYAAIVIQQSQPSTDNVGVQAALSAGLFIVKEDGAVRNISATRPAFSSIRFTLPSSTETTFSNTGNVQITPRASTLMRSSDRVIGKAVYNTQSASLMPGKTLRLQADIAPLEKIWLPKRISATIYPRYDDAIADGQTLSDSFLYVPPAFLGLLLVICACLVVFLRKLKWHAYLLSNIRAKRNRI